MEPPLEITTDTQGIRLLKLNRPAALNALSRALAGAIVEGLVAADAAPEVRAIVLSGSGERAFCAGIDLAEASVLTVAEIAPWFTLISNCYRQIMLVNKPVIVALNGVAAGAGYQMALVGDWRIGHSRTRLLQPEINVGLPSIMGAYLMGFHLSASLNQELSYTGRIMHAEECRRHSLLNELVTPEEFHDATHARALALAALSPSAFRATKARFRAQVFAGFEEARLAAIEGMEAAYAAGEPQARMARFLTPD